ncbi:MAG TPA: DNA ligase D [Thermoleophilaceae bacterium]|nr:DNA ligase D [Thermoleophilaceae bacterium]
MADPLSTYRGKRDPGRTPEPAGEGDATRAGRGGERFVVQEHDATRLHWDLRLEREGVLASWALPRGVPGDPKENRKAVRTEDHPIEYLDFEGEIPAGQYGAGTMRIFDRGTYECEKWREREVIVTFHGERVRGRYALFATGGASGGRSGSDGNSRDWMIHRMDPPEDADREPVPDRLVPMLATLGQLPEDEEGWAYEIKWDGVRALVRAEPGRVAIVSRNLNDVTAQYPEVARIGRALGAREALIDGEIVAFDEEGRPSFERLQRRMHLTSPRQVRERSRSAPVVYMAFDLLHLDGRSLLDRPWRERRKLLEDLELTGAAWDTPRYHEGDGAAFLAASRERGLEGIMAKRTDSPYRPGRRSGAWIKVKNLEEAELVIGGWMPGEGRRRDRIGALVVGWQADDGSLEYAGRVGTGFTDRELERLEGVLRPLRRERNPFARGRGPRGAVWVEPEVACRVEFREWTREGVLRAPSYQGLCERPAGEVAAPPPAGTLAASAPEGSGDPAAEGSAGPERASAGPAPELESDPPGEPPVLGPLGKLPGGALEATVDGRRLKLSNLQKVLFPATGFTKGRLVEYYARIAPAVLPHLHGRPLTLKRYPNGVEAEHFYEKQCPSHRPDWVATAAIRSERERRTIDYCLANDLPTLVWLANLADMELHPSLSLAEAIERPTTLAFDLDPGEPAGILDCARVALWVRELLGSLGLECLAKTSGSKGMQVYVPLNGETSYEQTKPFAKAVAELLEKEHRDAVVSRMSKSLRRGKVLVDWSQNDRHKTTVCVYSLRARERPTVSTPVEWSEVEDALEEEDPGRLGFEWDEVIDRVDERGDLFAPALTLVQDLPRL